MRTFLGCFAASATVALVFACTSTPSQPPLQTTGTGTPAPSGGGGSGNDAGGTLDGGSCAPALTGFSPVTHTATKTTGACTNLQLSALYAACFSSTATTTTCAEFPTSAPANVACNSCVFANDTPSSTASVWGPVLEYTLGVQFNAAGCLMLDLPSEEGGECATALLDANECLHSACDTTCGGSIADNESCFATAEATACSTYLTTEDQACATVTGTTCLTGDGTEDTFLAIAAVFCQ